MRGLVERLEAHAAAELLEDLGKKMEARFASTRNDDFRVPLRRNLSMVLGGANWLCPNTELLHQTPPNDNGLNNG